MVLIVGDLHLRSEEPFLSAAKDFLNWLKDSEWNREENSFFFLGDIFHKPLIPGKVAQLVAQFFIHELKAKNIMILQGNHDYARLKGNALDLLRVDNRVKIIDSLSMHVVEDKSFLCLPYFYSNTCEEFPGETMNSLYSNSEKSVLLQGKYDYILGHYSDETVPFFQDADTSYLKGKRIFGHIHNRVSDHYLGSSIITRKDEQGKTSYLVVIDNEYQEIKVPRFLDYVDVNYGEEIKEPDHYFMVNVLNSPSLNAAKERYSDYYINQITLKSSDKSVSTEELKATSKTEQNWVDLFVEKNKIKKEVKTKLKELFA